MQGSFSKGQQCDSCKFTARMKDYKQFGVSKGLFVYLLFVWIIQTANIADWCFRFFITFRCLFSGVGGMEVLSTD